MRRRSKKSSNLFKGVATAGAVVGGTTLFNHNVVYAAEVDDAEQIHSEGQIIETLEETSETPIQSLAPTEEEMLAQVSDGQSNDQEESVSAGTTTVQSTQESSEAIDSTGEESIPQSDSTAYSEASKFMATFNNISNNLQKDSESLSLLRSEIASQSGSLSAWAASNSTASSESDFLSNSSYKASEYEIENNYNSAYQEFVEQENKSLEEIITKIEEYKVKLNEAQTQSYGTYCRVADKATIYLAEYYFFQSYGTGEITNSENIWYSNDSTHGYQRNNLYLEYTDSQNKTHVGFFDWVALDESGYVTTDASKIADLMVVKKSPVYTYTSDGTTEKFYYYKGLDGTLHVYHGVSDGSSYTYEEIEAQVTETGQYTVNFEYNGSTYSTQMETGNYPEFAEVPNDIHYGSGDTNIKGYPYASVQGFDKKQDQYASQRSNYESASAAKSEFESQSESISNRLNSESTAASISASNSTAISTSASNSLMSQESLNESALQSLQSESKSVSEVIKQSESASNSRSESIVNSLSLEQSKLNKTSKSLSLSEANSKSVATSQSISASVENSKSVYTSTSIANSKSIADSERASEVAKSESISTSEANSKSVYESTSIKNSQSVADSQKASEAAKSESISLSEANSKSIATSQSISTSVENSKSVYTSTSIANSKSIADSERASEVAKSESISTSEANSKSVYESTSIKNSQSVADSQKGDSYLTSENVTSSESVSSNQTGYVTSMVLTDNSGSAFTQKIHVDTRPAPLQVAKEKTLQNANDILKTPLTNNKHAEELISSPMSPKSLLTTKVYWSWIPIIGAVVSAKETYSERKKERKETKEKEKLEKENEKQ